VRVELRNKDLHPFADYLGRGWGPMAIRESTNKKKFKAAVFYHANDPSFMERIVCRLPPVSKWDDLHLYFVLSHVSSNGKEDEFGFAFLRLSESWSRTVLRDGTFSIPIFKYSRKKQFVNNGYLNYDAEMADRRKTGEIVTLSTTLCSSVISQDPDVSATLTWQQTEVRLLCKSMRKVMQMPIAKLYNIAQALLDTLFRVLFSPEYARPDTVVHQVRACMCTLYV
jgi:hypothetical protein